MSVEKQYIDLFDEYEKQINQHSSEVMNGPRKKAMASFEKLGFPTRKCEKYKYTDIPALFKPDWGMNIQRVQLPMNPYENFKCDVSGLGSSLFFMVNDSCYPAREDVKSELPHGVWVGSLKDFAAERPEMAQHYYGQLADVKADAITAFNTAFAQEAIVVHVSRGVVVEKPLQIINILGGKFDVLLNRRILVILEEGAQLRLLVCDHAISKSKFLVTQVSEVYVGDGAVLDYYEVEETHNSTSRLSNLYIRQEASSNVLLGGVTLHGGVSRNYADVKLDGEHSEINMLGLAIADKSEHVDYTTRINHTVSHCTSRELVKFVLDDTAVGAFAGLVLVQPGAMKTDSRQTSRNLCVSPDARMYAQPQLEIYADDVQCSHGAAVGQLDEQAMFYMRSRGISEHEARLLLMYAFAGEVVDQIRLEALRERIHLLVEKRFRGELTKCQGCTACASGKLPTI